MSKPNIRVAMILPGLGRVQRGAETAFIEVARGLSAYPEIDVELFGAGNEFAVRFEAKSSRLH
jgi:hypothetical protein